MRHCTKCGRTPEEVPFRKDSTCKSDGLTSRCVECLRVEDHEQYIRNKHTYNAWYQANKHLWAEEYKNTSEEKLRRLRETTDAWCKKHPEKMREYAHKRDALLRGIGAEKVDIREVFERDNWVCQICGESVDKTLSYPDPLSASLDHIMPLSKHGKHSYANTQLVHWICNIRKSDRLTT